MNNISFIADRFGVLASTACALHCLLLPVMLVSGAIIPAAFLEEEFFHMAILLFILPAALVGFGLGCLRHKDSWVMRIGGLGLVGIISATFLHESLGTNGGRILAFISSIFLVAAHLRNYRMGSSASCSHA